MGAGHLIPSGAKLADVNKFTHVCTTLMDKVEQRHGGKLKQTVSPMIQGIITQSQIFCQGPFHKNQILFEF